MTNKEQRMNRTTQFLVFSVMLMSSIGQLRAGMITIEPYPSDGGNGHPLTTQGIRWQQGYDDSFFGSSPITITSFGFRSQETTSATYSTLTVHMSTTPVEPGSMSHVFTSNIGPDEALVLSGPITFNAVVGQFLTFTLDTPFNYDPTVGNLLIDIYQTGGTDGIPFDAYGHGDPPSPAGLERITNTSENSTTGTSFGLGELPTQFEFETSNSVPEPSSLALLAMSTLGSFGYSQRRQRK